jgi:hypothetical protein
MELNNKVQDHIRKLIKEVLDYDEKNAQKKSNTSFVDNEFEPLSATKTVNIDGSSVKISFLIDDYDNSLEVSFMDDAGTFALTNKNIIPKILSTVTYQTNDFLNKLNKNFIKTKRKLKINKLIVHPVKITDKDKGKKAIETSRGKIFDFYLKKIMGFSNITSDDNKITYSLSNPFKLGYDINQKFF